MELLEAAQALLTMEGRRDPYPYYRVLRARPVLVAGRTALVSGYAECSQLLRDPRLRSEDAEFMDRAAPNWRNSFVWRTLSNSMLFVNSPDHERMRRLVSRVFTARRVAALREPVEAIVAGLIERMRGLPAPVDLIAEFAYLLPITVICELLGVPEADRDRFRADAAAFGHAIELATSAAELAAADAAAQRLTAYFAELAEHRRAAPAGDLVSDLVRVHEEEPGVLSADELLANLALLLFAGFETTTNLLGNGVQLLLSMPGHAARLRADPSLAPAYVAEVLRYDSPAQVAARYVRDPVPVGDAVIPAGAETFLLLGAANRDPRRFPDPDAFDPARPDNQPLTFGAGAHHCLGAALARLEAEVAFPALLARLPGLAAAGTATRRDRMVLRGFDTLPVAF